jgi:hypothetical protein
MRGALRIEPTPRIINPSNLEILTWKIGKGINQSIKGERNLQI